jgi:spectinomycin phosphotransferase
MLEKPAIPDAALLACLRASFGVPAVRVAFLPVGNDARAYAYRVEGEDHRAYFLKLLRGEVYAASLAIPRYLAEGGIAQVVAPLAAATARVDDFTLILYPYVEGENGMDAGLNAAQWTELGAALRRIHAARLPADVAALVRHEDFAPPWAPTVRELAVRIETGAVHDPFEAELAAHWQPRAAEIAAIVARAEELGRSLRAQPRAFVLCHADIHTANVLIDRTGGLHIVDWDGVVLAPAERDLMFFDRAQAAFWDGYGRAEIDPVSLAYYRYEWVVQEIGDYGARVFSADTGAETKADAVRGFARLFAPGDVVEGAYLSDL